LVVKPDQLIKRRGKLGLILVNADIDAVKKWISERMAKDLQVSYFLNIVFDFKKMGSIK
jgi:ATP citrate (pro-S)-lyase